MKVKDYLEVAEDKLNHMKKTLDPEKEVYQQTHTTWPMGASYTSLMDDLSCVLSHSVIEKEWVKDGLLDIDDVTGTDCVDDRIEKINKGDIIIY